jgi:hypothetical protein
MFRKKKEVSGPPEQLTKRLGFENDSTSPVFGQLRQTSPREQFQGCWKGEKGQA